ncbi:hypothetical protein LLEC1_03232 [Akanthomyces lecanii]|uniref:Peptidase C51 domain-containing protein n=1 Tax=Cordyceps confragosa TaxID=2714763 RepID=A0A179ICD1_CORDF|nr:hypothetical protein LLEC1_03232 [Akanthomyces lecanii]
MPIQPFVELGYAERQDSLPCHLRAYAVKQDISLSCQAQQEDETWYKTSDDCFVSAEHVSPASSNLAACAPSSDDDDYASFLLQLRAEDGAATAAAAIPGPVTNDYPYSGSCSGVDSWAFYKCECTSFVAFRVNKRLGVKFTNQYKGAHWGDAMIWDDAARQSKVRIDGKPVPGCVAQTNAGAGHVAWVTKVSGDTVTVEEYNYVHKKAYGTRTVAKSTFSYIHIKV